MIFAKYDNQIYLLPKNFDINAPETVLSTKYKSKTDDTFEKSSDGNYLKIVKVIDSKLTDIFEISFIALYNPNASSSCIACDDLKIENGKLRLIYDRGILNSWKAISDNACIKDVFPDDVTGFENLSCYKMDGTLFNESHKFHRNLSGKELYNSMLNGLAAEEMYNELSTIKHAYNLMKAKCQKEPNNDSLNAIFQKLKTALDDLQSNDFLSINLSGLSRPYLEACSDYLNPVLQDFEQFDNYAYFVKTVSFLNTSYCTFENNVIQFFNSSNYGHCYLDLSKEPYTYGSISNDKRIPERTFDDDNEAKKFTALKCKALCTMPSSTQADNYVFDSKFNFLAKCKEDDLLNDLSFNVPQKGKICWLLKKNLPILYYINQNGEKSKIEDCDTLNNFYYRLQCHKIYQQITQEYQKIFDDLISQSEFEQIFYPITIDIPNEDTDIDVDSKETTDLDNLMASYVAGHECLYYNLPAKYVASVGGAWLAQDSFIIFVDQKDVTQDLMKQEFHDWANFKNDNSTILYYDVSYESLDFMIRTGRLKFNHPIHNITINNKVLRQQILKEAFGNYQKYYEYDGFEPANYSSIIDPLILQDLAYWQLTNHFLPDEAAATVNNSNISNCQYYSFRSMAPVGSPEYNAIALMVEQGVSDYIYACNVQGNQY